MAGFTDLHTHCIWGVDDGAQDAQTMREMLDEAHRQGISRIYATSHAELGIHPFPLEAYRARLEEARRYCREKGYDLQVEPGAELLYTPAMDAFIRDRRLIPLGDTDSVLVEFMPDVRAREIEWMLRLMADHGYRPILAHVERYACMRGGFPLALKRDYRARLQVNCRTVLEKSGLLHALRIDRWLRRGIVDFVATDMHNCASRPPRMAEAYQALCKKYGRDLADRLTKAEALRE